VSAGLRAYAVAVTAVAGAGLVAIGLRPALDGAVTPLFLAAVIVACWYGGRRPALVATGLALIVSEIIFDTPSLGRAGVFVGVAVLGVWLHGRAVEARERAEALARAREQLVRQEQAARADAETAGRSKDEFLAALSHELRTPLNALMGWIWWLRRGGLDADRQERALETIERNTASLAQLIEDLLDVARIVTGKLRLSVREVEPAPVIAAAIESLRPAADAKSIALAVSLDETMGSLVADPDRLQQIVWNLLSNAIKFTPDKGRVDVTLHAAGSDVVIEVRDSGQGIPAALLPHVFERFRQADARRPITGLGLGLSIVRHLVEMHGGAVRAASPGEGRGATFTVTLPLRSPASAEAGDPDSAPRARGPRLDDLRVLVVEDDADARLWLKESLESLGAVVLIATSVQEALETFERETPHVLVSDIRLPDADGYALLRRVRAVDAARGRQTPAIALTAYPRVEDRARALDAGFAMHVPKPVAPDELAGVIASLAGRENVRP
jgi:signal transduction histidine kinase/ActR/RegA family two-component response regulator